MKSPSTLDKLKNLRNTPMRSSAANTLTRVMLFTAPVAALLALVALFIAVSADTKASQPAPDVNVAIYKSDRVKSWATDFMTVWLAGTGGKDSQAAQTLNAMSSAPVEIDLPQTAYQVQKLTPFVENYEYITDDESVWMVRVDAQVVSPGSTSVEKYTYYLPVADYKDTFQAIAMPSQRSVLTSPFKTASAYSQPADVNSPLGVGAENFAKVYLTPTDSTSSLGAAVTADFKGAPVPHSLWKQVSLLGITWYGDLPSLDTATPGAVVHALATVQGSSSATTYSIAQLPLEMELSQNNQWLVKAIDPIVYYNKIEPVQ